MAEDIVHFLSVTAIAAAAIAAGAAVVIFCGYFIIMFGVGSNPGTVPARCSRRRRRRIVWIAVAVLVGLVFLVVVADFVLRKRSATGGVSSEREIALLLTKRVADNYRNDPPLSRYFGATYSERLPAALRLPIGILEAIFRPSDCDSMVRGLIYLLGRNGIKAWQLNLFMDTGVHSVVLVRVGGREIVLDPYLNVYFKNRRGEIAGTAALDGRLEGWNPTPITAARAMSVTVYSRYSRLRWAIEGVDADIPIWLDRNALPILLSAASEQSSLGDTMFERRIGAAWFLGPEFGSGFNKLLMGVGLRPGEQIAVKFWFEDHDLPSTMETQPQGLCVMEAKVPSCRTPPAGSGGASEVRLLDGSGWPTVQVTRFEARLVNPE